MSFLRTSLVPPRPGAAPRAHYQAYLLLALLVLAVHASGLVGPLVFDDEHAVRDNTAIRELSNLPAFFLDPDMFSATAGRMYRPLVLSTLAIDHWIGSGAAWAFKVGNLLQHLCVSLLFFAALPKLLHRFALEGQRLSAVTWIASLLFALHPLHVETLCLVSSRSEILMALGLGIALFSCLHFDGREGSPARPLLQMGGIAFGTAWACLSKETGVLVPPFIALLLFALEMRGRSMASSMLRASKSILLVMPVAFGYLAVRKALFGVATTGVRVFSSGGDPYSGGARDFETQLLGMTQFLPKAMGLWLFPWQLSLDHTRFEPLSIEQPRVYLGAACILVPLLLAVLFIRRRPLVSVCVLGAFGFSLPWILVPLNVPLAEHRLYVPVLLLSVPLAAGLVTLLRSVPALAGARRAVLLPALLLLGLGLRTVVRGFDWHESERLWRSTLAANDLSFRAHCGLADQAWGGKKDLPADPEILARAQLQLEAALSIYSRYLPALRNLCEVRLKQAELGAPLTEMRETVRMIEDFAMQRWKDPFVRLQAARARIALYARSREGRDLRIARSWALSCLAMVERKMLVYLQASEAERAGENYTAALALFDECRDRGLENESYLAAMGEYLIEAEELEEGRRLLAELARRRMLGASALGFAMKLAEATGDRRILLWAKSAGLQQAFGFAGAPR
ncbi:MAG: hypothetical protein CSA62_03455 [Planctomycetota bacterium]|nr:MAG: hypothetical protein CSA62_03455 [Planctomycetota bacterium]